jgi:hypothetical protein
MCTNWALGTALNLSLPSMRTKLLNALAAPVRGSPAHRLALRFRKMPGLMDDRARRTRAGAKLPGFRANRAGHRRIRLDPAQLVMVAAALSRHPAARQHNVVRTFFLGCVQLYTLVYLMYTV